MDIRCSLQQYISCKEAIPLEDVVEGNYIKRCNHYVRLAGSFRSNQDRGWL